MDGIELFTVYLKKDATIGLEINNQLLSETGTKIRDVESGMDKESLGRAVQSFINSINTKKC